MDNRRETGEPKYLAEVLEQVRRARPGFHAITVRHDSWCDLLAGKGPCNCNPEVSPAQPMENLK